MAAETEERQAIDPVFKQIVEEEFAPYKATCQTEYEVSRLPRTIDAFITVEDEAERQKIRVETPFFYLLHHSQIEFKGQNDRLTPKGYARIRGRMELLLSSKTVSPANMTVSIVSAGRPRTVIKYAKEERKRPLVAMAEPGYYKTDEQPPVYLIVINELPIVPKHYPLLLFASNEQKFRETVAQMIVAGKHTYIRYAYRVRPHVTKDVLIMAGKARSLPRKDLEFMANDIGPEIVELMEPQDLIKNMNPKKQKRLLALFTPEDRIADLTPEERLADLTPEERIADLTPEERIADLTPEEILKGMSPEKQKAFLDSLLKIYPVTATDEKHPNGGSNH